MTEKEGEAMELRRGRPEDTAGRPEKELRTYDLLDGLAVPYEQMDRHPEGGGEVRRQEEDFLDAMICKNILLRNRKGTRFYLLMIPRDKHFVTGDVTGQLGVSHLSFAENEHLAALLDTAPGSVSVLELAHDREGKVQLVMDRAVTDHHHFACHPCVNTASVRFSMEDFLHVVLPALGHPPAFVDLPEKKSNGMKSRG